MKTVYYHKRQHLRVTIKIWWVWISKTFLIWKKNEITSGKSKLKWKRHLYGIIISHRAFQCSESYINEICNQCESEPRINCFECGVVRSCKNCVRKQPKMKTIQPKLIKWKDYQRTILVICSFFIKRIQIKWRQTYILTFDVILYLVV